TLAEYPFTMPDKAVAQGYFVANDTLYRWAYFKAWFPVALTWALFMGTMLFVMLCINAILRKQWTDNERLTYPIDQLPLQITNEQSFARGTGLFHNRLFWLRFGIAAFIDCVDSPHVCCPAMPTIVAPRPRERLRNA